MPRGHRLSSGVSAVLLAAGAATRFGGSKLAARVDGVPILTRIVTAFLAAGTADVVVVLGCRADALRPLVPAPARTVVNARWESSMFSSVREGVRSIRRPGPVAITPADLAWLSAGTIERVLSEDPGDGVLVPVCGGRRGHPIVLCPALAARLLTWPDSARLSDLLHAPDVSVREIPGFDDSVLRDVDTVADLVVHT